MSVRRRSNALAFGALAVLLVIALIWGSDRITLQGERTIYTVTCDGGTWNGVKCTGRLSAGPRYGFRSSPARREVIYWVRGSSDPSGKFSDCDVVDRDNWTCRAAADQKPSIAIEMKKGRPTRTKDVALVQFHDVPKWKWWLIKSGLPIFSEALG